MVSYWLNKSKNLATESRCTESSIWRNKTCASILETRFQVWNINFFDLQIACHSRSPNNFILFSFLAHVCSISQQKPKLVIKNWKKLSVLWVLCKLHFNSEITCHINVGGVAAEIWKRCFIVWLANKLA